MDMKQIKQIEQNKTIVTNETITHEEFINQFHKLVCDDCLSKIRMIEKQQQKAIGRTAKSSYYSRICVIIDCCKNWKHKDRINEVFI